jgi:hypothetical protein
MENMKGRDQLENPSTGKKMLLEWILGKEGGRVWNRLTWLRTWTSGRPLCTWKRTFRFHKMWGIS